MNTPTPGCGSSYKICSPADSWRAGFGPVTQRALVRDLEELGGISFTGQQVEFYAPGEARSGTAPVMVVEVRGPELLVTYYGGDSEELLEKLRELVALWRRRYTEPGLAMVKL